jgi:ankyrin repeat protein
MSERSDPVALVLRAAAIGDLLALETHLTLHPASVATASVAGTGRTALHLSVLGGHADCVALMCEALPGLIHAEDARGFTPLDMAAATDNIIAAALLLRGAAANGSDGAHLSVARAEAVSLRLHRNLEFFKLIQDWRRERGLPQSPLVADGGIFASTSSGHPLHSGEMSASPSYQWRAT